MPKEKKNCPAEYVVGGETRPCVRNAHRGPVCYDGEGFMFTTPKLPSLRALTNKFRSGRKDPS